MTGVSASSRRWWRSRCHICSWRASLVEQGARRALSRARHRAKRLSFSSAVSEVRRYLVFSTAVSMGFRALRSNTARSGPLTARRVWTVATVQRLVWGPDPLGENYAHAVVEYAREGSGIALRILFSKIYLLFNSEFPATSANYSMLLCLLFSKFLQKQCLEELQFVFH